MNSSLHIRKQLLIVTLPLLMVVSIVFIAKSSLFKIHPESLSLAITADLLLTIPFVYFLLIRKTSISKTTIVPLIILGLVIGSIILPKENQYYLSLFKTWVFPVIEISIISFVIYKVLKVIKKIKKRKKVTFDFFTTLKDTCYEILPKKIVMPVVTEIAVFYYGFVYWKKPILKKNAFTYHKKSGTISLLVAIIFITNIELFVLHSILIKWNAVVAWALTLLSIYSAIQLFGFLKSITKRPIAIEGAVLKLHYGILSESYIDLKDIETVTLTNKDLEFDKLTRKLSPLGKLESHNVVITLKKENTLIGLYGIRKKFTTLALFVDTKEAFKESVDIAIKNLKELTT